jgi:hypothetical protein
MSRFTQAEIEYLQSQRLGRLATAGPDGRPHVVPVGFRYNPELELCQSGKYAKDQLLCRGGGVNRCPLTGQHFQPNT